MNLLTIAQTVPFYDSLIGHNGAFYDKVIRLSTSLTRAWNLPGNDIQTFYYDSRIFKPQPGNQPVKNVVTIYFDKKLNRFEKLDLLDDGQHFDIKADDEIYANYRVGHVEEFQTDDIIIDVLFDSIGLRLILSSFPVTFVPAPPKILFPWHQSTLSSSPPIVQWMIDANADGNGIILLDRVPSLGKTFGNVLWQKIYRQRSKLILTDTIPVHLVHGQMYHLIVWSYVTTRFANGQWHKAAFSMEWSAFSIDTTKSEMQPLNLVQSYPNPFNTETIISWKQAMEGWTVLSIYDMLGKEVKQLVNRVMSVGQHFAIWDGTNGSGISVSSGLYILQARFHDAQQSIKLILSR
jgi:hypothetical protein